MSFESNQSNDTPSEINTNTQEKLSEIPYRLDKMNSYKNFRDEESLTQLLEFFRQMSKDQESMATADIIFPLIEDSPELKDLSNFSKFYNEFECVTYCEPLSPPPEISFINQNNKYIGFIKYDPIRDEYYHEITGDFSLYLLPKFRKQGLGTKITNDFIESKKTEVKTITLSVHNQNQSGQESAKKIKGSQLQKNNGIFSKYVINTSEI